MTRSAGSFPPYGPRPWHQTSWDARAAGNFIGGGAGSGLIVFTAMSPAQGVAFAALMLAGLALVALGLFSVSLELGRPLRAVNVLRNPHTSWMSREAWVAGLLFPVGLAAAWGIPAMATVAALLALGFAYCQSRILQSARGIPAWRDGHVAALLPVSAMAEGGGLFLAADVLHASATRTLLALFAALVVARITIWLAYRRHVARELAPRAEATLERTGRMLLVGGTLVPLVLFAIVAVGGVSAATAPLFAGVAGLAAALAGSGMKFMLITRAGFNQGFALPHLPVRGTRP